MLYIYIYIYIYMLVYAVSECAHTITVKLYSVTVM